MTAAEGGLALRHRHQGRVFHAYVAAGNVTKVMFV